jgi:hypothetical protein
MDQSANRPLWLERLVSLFRVPALNNSEIPGNNLLPICETIVTEEPNSGQFCTHSRFVRWFVKTRQRMLGRVSRSAATSGVCSICGLLLPDLAEIESVLTVWFHDGGIYTYRFTSHVPGDCYRIADNALHINLNDSVLSYSLEIVSSVHFRKRRIPPVAPEVLAAERIIAGTHRHN